MEARPGLVSAGEWSPLWALLPAMWLSLSTDPSRRPHPGWARGQAGLLSTVLMPVPVQLSAPGMKCFFSLSEGVWLTPGGWLLLCW